MPWQKLESSMLEAVDYDPAFEVLHVRFPRGDVVSYRGVPADVARGLSDAESAGRYFHRNIKDRYRAL